jgi:hypothetical protein
MRSLKLFIIFYTFLHEELNLLGCNTLQSFEIQQTFRKTKHALLAAGFMLASCLAYSPNVKTEAKYSFETSVDFQQLYIPENRILTTTAVRTSNSPNPSM